MLVLTRKVGEQVVVPQCQLTVTILDTSPTRVRLGIAAPADLIVHRREVRERIRSIESSEIGESLESLRILIADRDEFLLTAYRDHFRRYGAVVRAAASGVACAEQLREFRPDVLVLDPAMPWGGGEGVLALMQEEPDLRPPFVLLLTHDANRSLLYRLSSFRVDDFQTKPISPTQLTERICTLRMRHAAARSAEMRQQPALLAP